MAEYSTYSDFYKVSFITTSSINIPKLLKHTGGLIIMNNTDDFRCVVNPEHGVHHPKSLWFRGDMIASGYGALCQEERDNLTYLAGSYNALFDGIHERFEDASHWINSYYNEFTNAMSYAYGEIDRVKKESYYYTDTQIENLIGCAPDTLDTLGEIAHWLEKDSYMGLDTVSHVKGIATSYVWHYDEVTPSYWYTQPELTEDVLNSDKYCYVGDYGLTLQPKNTDFIPSHTDSAGDYILDENGNKIQTKSDIQGYFLWYGEDGQTIYTAKEVGGKYLDIEGNEITIKLTPVYDKCSVDPGEVETSFPSFKTQYSGILALKDYQVSTHYTTNPSLYTVLNCLLEPYPYKRPEVSIYSYTPKYAEIGTTINTTINYEYKVNDAVELNEINGSPVSFEQHTQGNKIINVPAEITIYGNNIVQSRYTYKYSQAIQGYYPQLQKAGINQTCDDGKWEEANNMETVNEQVIVYGLYKLYGAGINTNNGETLPTNETDIKNGNNQFIMDFNDADNIFVTISDFTFDDDHDVLWFALPTNIYEFDFYIKNIHTEILQPISVRHESDILVYTGVNTYNLNGTIYTLFTLTNNRLTMASDYRLVFKLKRKA